VSAPPPQGLELRLRVYDSNAMLNRRVARSSRAAGLLLAWAAATQCSGLTGPSEVGLPLPANAGTVVVRVRDQHDAPVRNVSVSIELPDTSGGVFRTVADTGADGTVTFFREVPAGLRRVEIAPPDGFTAGSEPLAREIEVRRDASTTVDFRLLRTA
jgi:hypothetical protein